jgi:hypothetical protein
VISSNADLYKTVKDLSNELRGAGEEQWSAALDDTLSISSVAGEILGETRLQLKRLLSAEVATRLGLKGQVVESLSYLDRILGR